MPNLPTIFGASLYGTSSASSGGRSSEAVPTNSSTLATSSPSAVKAAMMGEMKRAIANEERERERQKHDRFASTLVIASSIIAAVRLARDENISRSSPRLTAVISDSVGLARMILNQIVR